MSPLYVPENILVTGGAGFIASHVVELLCRKYPQYRIIVLDSLEYCASVKNLEPVANLGTFKFIHGDIRSVDLIRYILSQEKVDTILHFAAETHVDNSFGNSFAFTETNMMGTHVLLEASRLAKTVRRFVHVSTDEVYGESSFENNSSNVESHPLTPTNPYSASKAAAEMLVTAYGTSYKLPYIVTRGNNVYGPRQYPEKAIPKFIHLLQRGKKIPVHGDGASLRSYMHVHDAATAFDHILHKGEDNNIYNIGSHEERTVLSVAKDICDVLQKDVQVSLEHVTDRAFNDRRYFVDCSKLEKLGWAQKISWTAGLRETIDWYLNVAHGYWHDVESSLAAHPQASMEKLQRWRCDLDK